MAITSNVNEFHIKEELLKEINEWSKKQSDSPSQEEAIQRLITIGLSTSSSDGVHLSDGEKLLILMMGDLFKSLKMKDIESDPEFLAKVIYGGHYWAAKWQLPGVFHDHVDNPLDRHHVVNVLDMWMFIEEAYDKLDSEQKAIISKEVGPRGNHVKFPGFDGNEESSQLSIASFLVEDLGRFLIFKGRDLNSHHPTYSHYHQMLKIFAPIRRTLDGRRLDIQELIQLLKA